MLYTPAITWPPHTPTTASPSASRVRLFSRSPPANPSQSPAISRPFSSAPPPLPPPPLNVPPSPIPLIVTSPPPLLHPLWAHLLRHPPCPPPPPPTTIKNRRRYRVVEIPLNSPIYSQTQASLPPHHPTIISLIMQEQIQHTQPLRRRLRQFGIGIISILLLHLQTLNTSNNSTPPRTTQMQSTITIQMMTMIMMIKLQTLLHILTLALKVITIRNHLVAMKPSSLMIGHRTTHRIHAIQIIVTPKITLGKALLQCRRRGRI